MNLASVAEMRDNEHLPCNELMDLQACVPRFRPTHQQGKHSPNMPFKRVFIYLS